jgi:hypothetical protein
MSICVEFPTIMDGLVLRWYADQAGYDLHREIANASRNCFVTFEGCTPEIPSQLAGALANATSVYLTQLTKLAEKQSDLLVPIEDTSEVTAQVASLAHRVRGQGELDVGNTTASPNGGEPITMDEMSRRMAAGALRGD